ncbi:MAG: DUF4203 domain-containing protein [Deltaproteobacteria bacterium]
MDINTDMFDFYMAAASAVGLIECFFGYRIFRFLLGVIGFITGAVIAGSLGFELSGGSELISVIVGLAGGFIGALLIYWLYFIGVFALGAALGFAITAYVYGLLNESPVYWVVAASSAAGGILAVFFRKPMIILATSFGGAFAAVTGIAYLLTRNFDPLDPGFLNTLGEDQLYRMAIIWFGLGVFGFVVQYALLLRREEAEGVAEGEEEAEKTAE